jgi:hypothetical protein
VSGPVFIFCSPGVISHGTEGVESRFQILRSLTQFWQYRVLRVPFSCFALPDSFSAILSVSAPILMFCASRLIFGGTEVVRSRFQVLRSRTHFWRYRGRPVPFSCFLLSESFPAVPRASGPIFKFCAPGLIFGNSAGIGSCFHVLHSQIPFR